jgi:mRNA-degrading endonuclease RelE of RelBE toxin-antitoxin system
MKNFPRDKKADNRGFFIDMYPKSGYNISMEYDVVIKKKVLKGLKKLPQWVQKKLGVLVLDLKEKGPEQPMWQNYSKLSSTEYHCHIGTSWAACWRHHKKTIVIEVYYVGSREKAPY